MRSAAKQLLLVIVFLLGKPGDAAATPGAKSRPWLLPSFVSADTVPGDEPMSAYEAGTSWFSRDKAYHFSISAAGAAGVYAASRGLGLNRWQSALASSVVIGTVGIWREIGTTDRTNLLTRQKISHRDLVWDGIGIAVGISLTDLLMKRD